MRLVWVFSLLGLSILVSSWVFLKKEPSPPPVATEQVSEMEQLLISEVFEQDETLPVMKDTQILVPEDTDSFKSEPKIEEQGTEVVILEPQPAVSETTRFDADVARDAGLTLNELGVAGQGQTSTAEKTQAELEQDLFGDSGQDFSSGALGALPPGPEQEQPLAQKADSINTNDVTLKQAEFVDENPKTQNVRSEQLALNLNKSESPRASVNSSPKSTTKDQIAKAQTPKGDKKVQKKPVNNKAAKVSQKSTKTSKKSVKVAEKSLENRAKSKRQKPKQQNPEQAVKDVADLKQSIISTSKQLLVSEKAANKNAIAVIVHIKNSEQLDKDDIRNIYTDRVAWKNGQKVTIFDLPLESKVRETFSSSVLNMTALEAATAASNRKVTNENKNIHKTKRDRLVASFVARNENAIGYVSLESVKNNKNVRIVYTIK